MKKVWMMVRLSFVSIFFWGLVLHASDIQPVKPSLQLNETTVVIHAVSKESPGPLLVYLYNSKDVWLKADEATQKTVIKTKGKVEYRWSLKNLPVGEYAVQVIHDEDANGALTMGFFGPSEGVGVSQYVPSFIPSFDKAKFKHNGQSSVVRVEMSY